MASTHKQHRTHLTPRQKQEIANAYKADESSRQELMEMYDVGESTFYRIMRDYGVGTKFKHNGHSKMEKVAMHKVEPEEIVHGSAPVQVVVDSNNIVQTARAVRRSDTTWEVKYTGTVLVEAEDVESAVREARKIGVVKRIYSVRIKGQ